MRPYRDILAELTPLERLAWECSDLDEKERLLRYHDRWWRRLARRLRSYCEAS